MKLPILLALTPLFLAPPAGASREPGNPSVNCDCSRCGPSRQCCPTSANQCGCFPREVPCPRTEPLTSLTLPVSAEALYHAMTQPELQLTYRNANGTPLPGILAWEKNNQAGTLCRKTRSGSRPDFTYACYEKEADGAQARRLYDSLATTLGVLYVEYANLLGSTYHEKANSQRICQKIEPVVPRPVASFHCYRRLFLP